ncbi:MAG: hypothetical protein ABI543_04050 [Ignavibacteria bacterium]
MKITLKTLLLFVIITGSVFSQQNSVLKLSGNKTSLKEVATENHPSLFNGFNKDYQLKTRKTVSTYFGAGYSFMIFTNKYMSTAFPILDTRNGSFLTNINLFIGFAIAKAVTLEFSPSILFTSNNKQADYSLSPSYNSGTGIYQYAHTYTNGIIALPMVINARFFPMFKQKGFARLFFIGGGIGAAWIREENDVIYNNTPNTFTIYGSGSEYRTGLTTSQWAPIFKVMTGFTGTGGQFGFGGEVSYNIIPLKQDTSQPFATRFAKDFNSVDITLRFYFSL